MRKSRNIFFVRPSQVSSHAFGLLTRLGAFLRASKAPRIAAMLSLVLVASSCRWTIEREYDPDVALTFLPSVSKPGGESQPVPEDGSFGLSLWRYTIGGSLVPDLGSSSTAGSTSTGANGSTGEGANSNGTAGEGANSAGANGAALADLAEQIEYMSSLKWDEGKWVLPDEPLWPSRRHGLLSLAYSPFEKGTACNLTEGVVFGDYDAAATPTLDLLYTDVIYSENKNENGGAISLPFHHAMTELSFRFIPYNPTLSIRIRQVRIPSVYVKGTFNSLPKTQWTFSGETSSLTYDYVTDFLGNTPTAIPSIFLPPQKISEGFVIGLSYIDPLGVERDMLVQTEAITMNLLGDRQYIFTVSVNPDSAKVIETSINKQYESQ